MNNITKEDILEAIGIYCFSNSAAHRAAENVMALIKPTKCQGCVKGIKGVWCQYSEPGKCTGKEKEIEL